MHNTLVHVLEGPGKAGTNKKAAAPGRTRGCFFLGPGLGPWPLQCMHKSVVHAQECCACTRILCMHKNIIILLYYYISILFKALRAVRRARSPILMFNLGVPKEFTFRATSRVSFCTFGVILEVIFGPWEHFRGAVGSFLRPKTAGGTKGGPRAAKEAPPPK